MHSCAAWILIVASALRSHDRFPTTRFPTKFPTRYSGPTKFPTSFPSKRLTKFPTRFPSRYPSSASPTEAPTEKPSSLPGGSKYPTRFPTRYSGTKFPTTFPTTKFPTTFPTTKFPSRFPTNYPVGAVESEWSGDDSGWSGDESGGESEWSGGGESGGESEGSGTTHNVGGASAAWVEKPYTDLEIAVGDSVKFAFGDAHDVWLFASEAKYDACDFGGGTELAGRDAGALEHVFSAAGDFFLGCKVSDHCENGMKVKVAVGQLAGGCPAAFQAFADANELARLESILVDPGCETGTGRVSIDGTFTKADSSEMRLSMGWDCYCTAGRDAVTQFVGPGPPVERSPERSRNTLECRCMSHGMVRDLSLSRSAPYGSCRTGRSRRFIRRRTRSRARRARATATAAAARRSARTSPVERSPERSRTLNAAAWHSSGMGYLTVA